MHNVNSVLQETEATDWVTKVKAVMLMRKAGHTTIISLGESDTT